MSETILQSNPEQGELNLIARVRLTYLTRLHQCSI